MKQGFLTSILMAAALAFGAGPAAAQPKEVKFGCYAPLTGQLAIFGKSMQQGFEMAIDEFAKTPQSKGIKFTIQCEDDQGRADDGINIARKFVEDQSIVAVLGSWASTVTLAAGPIYNQGKLVNITPISSHPDVTKVGPYVFRQSLVQSQEGAFNGATLAKLGAKKIAMIGIPNDYGKANMSLTRSAFEAKGGKVVFEEYVRPDAQDFRQPLQKAIREEPDWIYIGAFAPQTALMLKQLRQMGSKIPVYVAAADDTPDLGAAGRHRRDRRHARDGADQPGARARAGRVLQALQRALRQAARPVRRQLVQHGDDDDGARGRAVPERHAREPAQGARRDPLVRRHLRQHQVRPGHARVGVQAAARRDPERRHQGRRLTAGACRCSTRSSSVSSPSAPAWG